MSVLTICVRGQPTLPSKVKSMSQRLGDLLVKEKIITPEQLAEAMKIHKQTSVRLTAALVKLGSLTDEDIANFFSRKYGVPAVNLACFEIDPEVVKLVPFETAKRYQILPLNRVGASLTIAMADPTNVFATDDVKFMTGFNIEPVVAAENAILAAIDKAYGTTREEDLARVMETLNPLKADPDVELEQEEQEAELVNLEQAADEAPIVKLVNLIMSDAVKRGASDIHLEPYEKEFRVRFRVDGLLMAVMTPPVKLKDAIVSRVKIMAKLDISEKRLPQDGRIMLKMNLNGRKKQLDFRVSTLPTLWGEKIVLRLLDKESLRLDMTQLGFEQASLVKFERAILKPYGMVLVTGPTGSGKTNTLYSSISRLNSPQTNIMTAEDPIEFQLMGVNQVQVKEQIGLTFATALRAFLRQDPNIILVGEIRDIETAEIAVKAALTGHLVLSTLHTNGAAEAITRLMNMGIEPFLVATSLHLICAQRLVRRVCVGCSQRVEVPLQALIDAGFGPEEAKDVTIHKGKGCPTCNGTGYKGRTGLYEVMEMDDDIREMVLLGASSVELKKKAVEHGMITLHRSGLIKVALGVTTLEEVARETIQ